MTGLPTSEAVPFTVPLAAPVLAARLFHPLTAQTSSYRVWGAGQWTAYVAELARHASATSPSTTTGRNPSPHALSCAGP